MWISVEEISSASVKKARKNHRCTWCDELILKGEPYESYTGAHDGQIGVTKFHPECDKAVARDEGMQEDNEIYPGYAKRGMTVAETEEAARNQIP